MRLLSSSGISPYLQPIGNKLLPEYMSVCNEIGLNRTKMWGLSEDILPKLGRQECCIPSGSTLQTPPIALQNVARPIALMFSSIVQCRPKYQLHLSPHNAWQWGTQTAGIGVGREILENSRFLKNFHRKPQSGHSGKFILGNIFWWFGGILWGKMRMAKDDMMGRGEVSQGIALCPTISGSLWLRVQSQLRTQLRITACIAFLLHTRFEGLRHYTTTIARLNFLGRLEWGGWELYLPGEAK